MSEIEIKVRVELPLTEIRIKNATATFVAYLAEKLAEQQSENLVQKGRATD